MLDSPAFSTDANADDRRPIELRLRPQRRAGEHRHRRGATHVDGQAAGTVYGGAPPRRSSRGVLSRPGAHELVPRRSSTRATTSPRFGSLPRPPELLDPARRKTSGRKVCRPRRSAVTLGPSRSSSTAGATVTFGGAAGTRHRLRAGRGPALRGRLAGRHPGRLARRRAAVATAWRWVPGRTRPSALTRRCRPARHGRQRRCQRNAGHSPFPIESPAPQHPSRRRPAPPEPACRSSARRSWPARSAARSGSGSRTASSARSAPTSRSRSAARSTPPRAACG